MENYGTFVVDNNIDTNNSFVISKYITLNNNRLLPEILGYICNYILEDCRYMLSFLSTSKELYDSMYFFT